MPRRKKNGQSPARHTGGPPEGEGVVHSTGYDGAGTNNFPPQISISSADKEEMVKSMKEMFSHLDREVIYIVLSECDFKAENAMDSLLELSVAAEKAAPIPPPLSGFERTAAALLSPHHLSEPRPDPHSSRPLQHPSSPPPSYLQTDELDLVVDQELNTLTAEQDVNNMSLSSFPPPPFTQQALPELLQTSMELGSRGPSAQQPRGSIEHVSGASSPLDQLSTWKDQVQQSVVDFSHLMRETCTDQPKPPPDLAASGRPSAFQVYKKQNPSHAFSESSGLTHTDVITGGARAKANMLNVEPPGFVSSSWNLEAPAFSHHIHGNQGPAFITPMAHTQPYWTSQHRHASPWLTCGPPSQAPLKHSAPVPRSWTLNAAPQVSARSSRLHLEGKLLVLLRGAPGSGKSTMARALLEHNPGGVILSTDDYFIRNGQYLFDPTVLGEAHEWNHKRAKEAFERGTNPIIIDNTNMQGWEMKPYVAQALKHGYKVLFREPDTWWKNKARELGRRSTHNIPVEKIRRMLDGYERFVSVQSIMGSQMPEGKQRLLLENKSLQQVSTGTPCPDLVGQPGLIENFKESQPQMFSSLPDVSSVGRSEDAGTLKDSNHKSSESLNFPLSGTGRPVDTLSDSNWDDDIDLGDLDSELDTQVEMYPPVGNQRIPDCVVESVMNDDHCEEEAPVAFCESIGQRVRRERPSRRSGFDRMERVDLVKDTNQSDNEEKDQEHREGEKTEKYTEEKTLNFVGDWPCEESLQQRQVRSKQHKEVDRKDEGASQESNNPENTTCVQLGPGVTEFQKLLDLIQTGVAPVQSDSCCSDSLSPNSGDKNEDEAGQASQGSTSSSDEREPNITRGDSSRGELPDCVLDWKAADSVEVNVCSDSADCYSTEGGTATNLKNNSKETKTSEADDSNISETCHSPVCDSSVETESSVFSGSSQERKQRQSRRSGKQCKLALTFTQNCPLDSPSAPSQNSVSDTDVKPDFHPDCNLSPDLKTNLDLFPESKSDAHLLPPTPLDLAEAGCSTQTEPQDFGLLWRLNRLDNSDDTVVTAGNYSNKITVMSGDASRFVPTTSTVTAAAAVHPSNHREVPYRVVHEKGTQVEEKDLGLPQDRLESLQILSRHFRQVSFDTLEDLYDKCHQDLEWTTNLLLDSGEKFFREQDGGIDEDFQNPSNMCVTLDEAAGTSLCPNIFNEQHEDQTKGKPAGMEESIVKTVHESHDETANKSAGAAVHSTSKEQPETDFSGKKSPQTECSLLPKVVKEGQKCDNAQHNVLSYPDLEIEALGGSFDKEVIIEESRIEIEDDDISSMEEVNRLLLEDMETEERKRKKRDKHLDILSVELKLPTELALQLTELFGPVGVDPGMCSAEDNTVQMDLNLAKLLHQKWKETIQERQRQEALSFHLLQESSVHWGDSQAAKAGPPDQKQLANFLMSPDGYTSLDGQSEACGPMPFMDHWNVSRTHVSLRDIIKEEQMLQENVEKTRQSRADLDRRDGATLLKENQLYSLFPTIDRHFLLEIFRDHNYSLTQTEQFLRSLLDEEPVKMVVAPAVPLSDHHRAASKEREKKQNPQKSAVPDYQDTEDPEYEDFRAEARLQRSRQLESFAKAAEAYKQGRREVASFYAQQGHMHGQRMHEANDRAAAQIFEKINASLLPRNILDLHGLHVDEALEHLAKVLQDKTTDCNQGLCRPQLSVITGRGNHSQGGVARIRPAVIDYLTNRHYRFTEPKPGLVLVSLK
ncbi:NEDD4-binding protein 2 isoform X2 [Parambassis ranga]|uniref:NEDD4-binding protein 2 isoform X2 n=1 Tax=Parambassis ranga TaxID=210632 RepID=A0A6P7I4G6_9TELE|nr:NEDD4-binding protein 2 isoform X2 [Parambassis ranga]